MSPSPNRVNNGENNKSSFRDNPVFLHGNQEVLEDYFRTEEWGIRAIPWGQQGYEDDENLSFQNTRTPECKQWLCVRTGQGSAPAKRQGSLSPQTAIKQPTLPESESLCPPPHILLGGPCFREYKRLTNRRTANCKPAPQYTGPKHN